MLLKVCRIIAFYRFWAIILPTFGGLGNDNVAVQTTDGRSYDEKKTYNLNPQSPTSSWVLWTIRGTREGTPGADFAKDETKTLIEPFKRTLIVPL